MDAGRAREVHAGYRSGKVGLLTHGKNWKMVEQVVGTRTASQVRSHAQKFFNRLDREQLKMERKARGKANEDSEHEDPQEELEESPQ